MYNSLTFKKEEFKTIKPNEVLMYVCGPTVYDNSHLGHAKSAVSFDIIRRYLEFKGYNVKMVKNYTDIDDKIIKRANEENVDYRKITEKYIKEYEDIMKILNIKRDFKNPRATEVVNFMIEIIQSLISKGYAYETNSSVYYSVKKFPKYKTVLINISEEQQDSEAEEQEEFEIISEDEKENRKDFALWKKSKENEPYWESPWGNGRPGWHIECSAMAIKFLGETIDIHGGGQDLKFPHHRNEIAQSEAYTGKQFAKYFLHNGFVKINDEKMSKSLNNFFLVSDVIKKYDPMVLRLFLLSSQYRSSIDYSLNAINHARKQYEKIINSFRKISEIPTDNREAEEISNLVSKIDESESKIIQAMDDDFNTPIAIAVVMKLLRQVNGVIIERKIIPSEKFKAKFSEFIQILEKIFGIFPNLEKTFQSWMPKSFDGRGELIGSLIDMFSEVRSKLRENNVFDLSDNIRNYLNNFWEKKELDLSLGGNFDERGKIIVDLIQTLIKIRNKIKENDNYEQIKSIEEEINASLRDLELGEDLDLKIAGSFDERGELINTLLKILVNVRSHLRNNGIFDVIDVICEDLRDFWIKKELNVEIAGSFDKRGEVIEALLDLLIKTRNELRKRKLYKISDFIRENMKKLGIAIEDI